MVGAKIKRALSLLFKSPVSWLIFVVIYLFIGAAIFQAIEERGQENDDEKHKKTPVESAFVGNVTGKYGVNLTTEEFVALFRDIEGYIRGKEEDGAPKHKKLKDLQKWMYFCFITLTTIGYGDVSVTTSSGKVALIFYALFGIPLMLTLLGMVGNKLTLWQTGLIKILRRQERLGKSKVVDVFSALLSGLFFVIYLLIGAAITTSQEGWDFLTSIYFWFVTFSTIGYGDYISYGNSDSLLSVVAWIFFRLVGLALVAGIIDCMFKWLTTQKSKLGDKKDSSADREMQPKT